MAALTSKNPVIRTGAREMRRIQVPSAAVTWEAGQFLKSVSGHATACATNDVTAKYYALSDQASAPSAGDLIDVGVLEASQTFEINELDGTLSDANVGQEYELDVTSNVCTLDVAATTNKFFRIVRLASDYEPEKNTSADTKARCEVSILQSVIDA